MKNSSELLTPARGLIGMPYAASVKPYVLEITGLHIAVGPNDISTKDRRIDRVFIEVNDEGFISNMLIG